MGANRGWDMNKPTWTTKGWIGLGVVVACMLVAAGCAPAPPPYGATDSLAFTSASASYAWSEPVADVTALVSGACSNGPQALSAVATLGDGSTVYFGFNVTWDNPSPPAMPFGVGTYGTVGDAGYGVYVEQRGDFTAPGLGFVPEDSFGSVRGTGTLTIQEITTGPETSGPCGPQFDVTRLRATFSFYVSSSYAGRPGDYLLWSGSLTIG